MPLSPLLLTILGIVARHLLTALGASAVAVGLPAGFVSAITSAFAALGPTGQVVGGVVLLGAGLAWSWWQKMRAAKAADERPVL